jgi:hypothetical protein
MAEGLHPGIQPSSLKVAPVWQKRLGTTDPSEEAPGAVATPSAA